MNPDADTAPPEMDSFYRPTANQIFAPEKAGEILEKIKTEHLMAHPEDEALVKFIEWAVTNDKIKTPKFPGIIRERPYVYYQKLHNTLHEMLDDYRTTLSDALREYEGSHPGADIPSIIIPDEPSGKWLKVMQPTSIAMGKMLAGVDESFNELSPRGIIWRADTVRGLLDSLEHAGADPVFSVLSVLRPELLTEYFMKCHPIVYNSGRVPFGSLSQSDARLIVGAASTTLSEYGGLEVLRRACQLVESPENMQHWREWVPNAGREAGYLARHIRHTDTGQGLPPEVQAILIRLIDGGEVNEAEIASALGGPINNAMPRVNKR